eukprot:802755-Amphidinium_carterae.1
MAAHDIAQRLDTQHRLKCFQSKFQKPVSEGPCADGDCSALALDTAGRALVMGRTTLAEANSVSIRYFGAINARGRLMAAASLKFPILHHFWESSSLARTYLWRQPSPSPKLTDKEVYLMYDDGSVQPLLEGLPRQILGHTPHRIVCAQNRL